jgi:hypothetical protein
MEPPKQVEPPKPKPKKPKKKAEGVKKMTIQTGTFVLVFD